MGKNEDGWDSTHGAFPRIGELVVSLLLGKEIRRRSPGPDPDSTGATETGAKKPFPKNQGRAG